MTTKHKPTIAATPQIVRSDNYISVYASNAQLQMSSFDVRMIFGEVSASGEVQQIEQKVSIVMSLHHPKVFAQLISENLPSMSDKSEN